MYDYSTGAVYDGLNSDGINYNQGAESVVCFLMALSSLNKHINGTFSTVFQSRVNDVVVSDEDVDDGALEEKEATILKSGGMREIR